MSGITRREFLQRSGATAAIMATAKVAPAEPVRPKAADPTSADTVTLGQTGLQLSRLGLGTGSQGGQVQRDLGQAGFTRLVRHAFDRGIRYFDVADAYRTHVLLKPAIKDLPREELFIQTKIGSRDAKQTDQILDRFRQELGTDYLDSVLMHCMQKADWPETLKPMQDALSKAKQKGIIRAHGVSCHGLPGLSGASRSDWVDVGLVRINPQGKHVDGVEGKWDEPGDVEKALVHIRKMHAAGKGVIGMKIFGSGSFTDPADREKSIRFAMGLDCLDAVVIGFASPDEIDEAIQQIDAAEVRCVRIKPFLEPRIAIEAQYGEAVNGGQPDLRS
ncbi:hypothetical protein LCGC14_1899820 [marine sediment metagenome]|uniref:NADP-dependent oxidoreductase domain-containing protein n=1 Tax=marine sediment metagenome TaxID=412755 RepID=A0A0F9FWY5_9ZZZZ